MSWERFKKYYLDLPELGLSLDISGMNFPEELLEEMEPRMQAAFNSMKELEEGEIANSDEGRMVGHYWLRNPALSPNDAIRSEIEYTHRRIRRFTERIHLGEIAGQSGPFRNLLVIGIGGSALGAQLISQALGDSESDKLALYFFDNTDPDGFDSVISRLRGKLGETLVVVVSKSGSTPETRNGMIEAEEAYKNAGLEFARHAAAVTGRNSKLDRHAASSGWLIRLPLWDWVGGRTSVTGPVGLLPAALQGLAIEGLLNGAAVMDEVTREAETKRNPAALLALMWYYATDGRGTKDMVILPYKDRLMLFSKYLQQLIMESLGKERDLDGETVNQGIAVYGNKGSTDQHAYVQQLREGIPNFFVTFIEVLRDREGASVEVEPGNTSGDYLEGFLLGTRAALHENGRESITITVREVSAGTLGMLIALYERAVGFYAGLVNINAYNQPGVEAGKRAAANLLELKNRIQGTLRENSSRSFTAENMAMELRRENEIMEIFKLMEFLAANPDKKVEKIETDPPHEARFQYRN